MDHETRVGAKTHAWEANASITRDLSVRVRKRVVVHFSNIGAMRTTCPICHDSILEDAAATPCGSYILF
jgi:hypothetical protein